MVYNEIVKDLFTVDESYYLAHCISADFALGAGIAVQFNKLFDMRNLLKQKYPTYVEDWQNRKAVDGSDIGDCLLEGRVFNLITKHFFWKKPTYVSMRNSLEQMKELCIENNITKIAMPIIGCGLDKLQWNKVSVLIKEIFENTDIEILVCKEV